MTNSIQTVTGIISPDELGPEQAELLISLGADPKKLQIGHMNGNIKFDYQRATINHGVKIAFDS